MSICKYCGQPIENEPVMSPDEYGNGYHHFCFVDKEFREERRRLYNKGKADAFKWTPVSEGLPEDEEYVLGCYANGNMRTMYFYIDTENYPTEFADCCETGWYDDDENILYDQNVIAWMPLPAPYKAESEEQK